MALKAQVLYDFKAEPGNNELSVRLGETITVLNQTVGGGWIKAQNSSGQTGLVPEGYLQVSVSSLHVQPAPSSVKTTTQTENHHTGTQNHHTGTQNHHTGTQNHHTGTQNHHTGSKPPHRLKTTMQRLKTTTQRLKTTTETQNHIHSVNILPVYHCLLSTSAPEDDDGEWDDDWDDQSVSSYRGNSQVNEESGATGRGTHGSSVKISLNKSQQMSSVGEVGPVWLYPPSPLDCVIADPKKESKLYGLKSFIEYQITPNTTNRPVNHRYKHFDWLYERLLEKFGSVLPIPLLPDKQVTGRFEEDFIRIRMEGLQAWMSRLCRHPVVSQSEVFQLFLTYRDEKEWKAGKRKAEKDETVGPMIFSLIDPEAAELDATDVERRCEQYSRFTKSMEDGVRELLNVGHTHWKRCTGPLPKEYQRIGRAFRNLSTVFNTSKYPGEETLTDALTAAGQTYEEIAQIISQQPQEDLHFLLETNSEYKGLLGCFPEIIAVHKAAVEKAKEADRLVTAGKINNDDRTCMNHRISCMSYSLQAEMNHFHSNRIYDYNRVMQLYLERQVTFYQQVTKYILKYIFYF
uniref:Sorting nexin n=1 Tax=Mastacembelus armatus TaxID=205130 RepID=A0A7N9B069_9TELE